jgi:galactose mutarotase-like enzyme
MACRSLTHQGEELLGAVRGPGVPDVPWITGIPLLHPWANRLGGFGYGDVDLTGSEDLYIEEHGLPLHGLRSAVSGWSVVESAATRLVGAREFAGVPEFPFPHRLEVAAELDETTLTLETTLTAGIRPVPLSFGYHPFFRLPSVPRERWEIALPVAERLILDAELLPTGARVPAGDLDGPLGERHFDDGFTLDAGRGPFVLEGGGRRIEVAFETGYPYAQIFAPAISDVICFEPMTAPADALRNGADAVAPGERFTARFSITVSTKT